MQTVLIVEDNRPFREKLREILAGHFPDVQIEEAEDGTQALEIVNRVRPDLVFMDIKLPGENGLSITRKLTTQHDNIPVVVLSNYDLPEYQEVAAQSGASHFLSKGTVGMDEILDLVRTILGRA
jgi:DNA-binding NarL/FixJ family response regulator